MVLGVIAGLILLVILGGLAVYSTTTSSQSKTKGEAASKEQAESENQKPASEESSAPKGNASAKGLESSSTSGRGSDARQIGLKPGLFSFSYSYQDEGQYPGYFAVELLDDRGSTVQLIASHVGTTQGSKVVRIPREGTYYVNIQANNGSWTLETTAT